MIAWLFILIRITPTNSDDTFFWKNATSYRAPEKQLENLVNREQERVCNKQLTPDNQLLWMARYRATDMVINNYFAHTNPNTGERVFRMLESANIPFALAGENIGWTNTKNADTARFLFDKFMKSTTHRKLIQDCQYSKIGVGAYTNTERSIFVMLVTRQ